MADILRDATQRDRTCPQAPPQRQKSRSGLLTQPTVSQQRPTLGGQPQTRRWTTPHSVAMTCLRLGGGRASAGGTPDPCHCHLWTTATHDTALSTIDTALQTATRKLARTRPQRVVSDMLRDLSMLALNRAHDRGAWEQTADHLVAVLTAVTDLDPREVDISPPSDTSPKPPQTPQGTLPQHVA